MSRSARVAVCLIAFAVVTTLAGCPAEVDDPDRGLAISGTVTYRGNPVKKGAIHFLPTAAGRPAASGKIADGAIKDVSTQTEGDGINAGTYRIAIVAFDDAFLESSRKRGFNGADPQEVARAVNEFKPSIPARYSSVRESGLVEEISPTHREIKLELVD